MRKAQKNAQPIKYQLGAIGCILLNYDTVYYILTAAVVLFRGQAFFDRDTPIGLRQWAIIKTASSYEPPNLMNRKRKWRL